MADQTDERARFCAHCGRPVVVPDAVYCKECGRPLPNTITLSNRWPWSHGIALVLSILPGLGHWYKGQFARGLVWFVIVSLLYSVAWPLGFVLHLICAANAALSSADSSRSRRTRHRRHTGSWLAPMATPR